MNKENIAKFFHKALERRTKLWKRGELSNSEYNKFMAEAYEKLRGLGMTDQDAKDIIKGIEEAA